MSLSVFRKWVASAAILLSSGLPLTASAVCRSPDGRILGFTPLAQSYRTRHVFVSSSSGNDSNSGFSPSAPKRTIAAGYALLRNGQPDWLMLKSGDTFNEGIEWNKSGLDSLNRMVMTTYGGSRRARLRPPRGQSAIAHFRPEFAVRHVAFTHLDLEPANYDPMNQAVNSGVFLLNQVENVLVENLKIAHFGTGLVVQATGAARSRDIAIRRNVIVENHVTSESQGHSQGAYFSNIDRLLIEENFLDQNGHLFALGNATMFNHGLYIQGDNRDVVLRGNIVGRSSSHGAQQRSMGIADNNLFYENPLNLLLGSSLTDPVYLAQATGVITRNVVIGSRDINASNPRGFGIDTYGGRQLLLENNIISSKGQSGLSFGYSLTSTPTFPAGNITMRNNKTYNWGNDITFNNTGPMGTVVLEGNELHETTTGSPVLALLGQTLPSIQSGRNRMSCSFLSSGQGCAHLWRVGVNTIGQFYTRVGDSSSVEAAPQFADPERNLATYYRKIRGSTAGLQGFIEEAKMQGEGGWKCELMAEEINEYIRAGFAPVDPSIVIIRK